MWLHLFVTALSFQEFCVFLSSYFSLWYIHQYLCILSMNAFSSWEFFIQYSFLGVGAWGWFHKWMTYESFCFIVWVFFSYLSSLWTSTSLLLDKQYSMYMYTLFILYLREYNFLFFLFLVDKCCTWVIKEKVCDYFGGCCLCLWTRWPMFRNESSGV